MMVVDVLRSDNPDPAQSHQPEAQAWVRVTDSARLTVRPTAVRQSPRRLL